MTFSIGWPTGFKSRTGNPADPCFIGSIGGEKNKHKPTEANQFHLGTANARRTEATYRSHKKKTAPDGDFRFHGKDSIPLRVYRHLKAHGPTALADLADVAGGLGLCHLAVRLSSAVNAGVIDATRGANPVYSIGAVVPRGEA